MMKNTLKEEVRVGKVICDLEDLKEQDPEQDQE